MVKVPQLSKSRFCLGVQCLKALYLKVHEPDLAAPVDAAQQMIFDQGTAVGIEAQKSYPGGVLIESDYRHSDEALKLTAKAIAEKAPAIFEATILYDNTLVRVDILKRNKNGSWDIVEVKSSTDVKDTHISDLAIQTYVATGSGLKISKGILKHLNRESVFPDLSNLLLDVDCTERVKAELESVPELIKTMTSALSKSSAPKMKIGPHCNEPYECAFKSQCWGDVPKHSVFELNGVWGTTKFDLYHKGVVLIKDIGEGVKVSRAKPQQLAAVRAGEPVIDTLGNFEQQLQAQFIKFSDANQISQQLNREKKQVEKYERFLNDELLNSGYSTRYLDLEGAKVWFAKIKAVK